MKLFIFCILPVYLCFVSDTRNVERSFFLTPSFDPGSLVAVREYRQFNDTIPSDTLTVYKDHTGRVRAYSREIVSGVCMDGLCRPLFIRLFWTVTGRYLGLVLPEGEFLSKTEHVPFRQSDYDRLQEILSNPYSALGEYETYELTAERAPVDGVTAATMISVKDEAVPDAVFTTFTLWHIVYGDTRRKVQTYTRECMDDTLVLRMLQSDDFSDRMWVLENLGAKVGWTAGLRHAVLDKALHERGLLAAKALDAIPDSVLAADEIQLALADGFPEMTFTNQRRLLERWAGMNCLNPEVPVLLASRLNRLSPNLINSVFEFYRKRQVADEKIDREVALLLEQENRFVVRKAREYLEERETKSREIKRKLKKIR